MPYRRTALTAAGVVAVAAATAAGVVGGSPSASGAQTVVWVVGDLCDNVASPRCAATADLIARDADADRVLMLGDAQYDVGSAAEFTTYWDPAMAAVMPLMDPVPGNHEYGTAGAGPYFDTFGAAAGTRGQGWHAATVGGWTLVGTNTNCSSISSAGGCGSTSPQATFVKNALAASPQCEIVFGHHPVLTDDRKYAPGTSVGKTMFTYAYNGRAELYLSGHTHNYQRFAPHRPDGTVDWSRGTRSMIVGTGGIGLVGFKATKRSQYRQSGYHGAARLVLGDTGYSASFVGVDGTVRDTFTGTCR